MVTGDTAATLIDDMRRLDRLDRRLESLRQRCMQLADAIISAPEVDPLLLRRYRLVSAKGRDCWMKHTRLLCEMSVSKYQAIRLLDSVDATVGPV